MQLDFTDKTVLITGASYGLGEVFSHQFAEAGAELVLTARSTEMLDGVAAVCREKGSPKVTVVTGDVSIESDVQNVVATGVAEHGRIDVLVNNAGIGHYGPVVDFSTVDFDEIMRVNLRGTFLCCREALRIMQEHRSGTIINIASVVGIKGYPLQAAYTASKHGMMGLTKSLAVEAQTHGVRVSAVLPGGVATEMVTQSRPDLDPDELLQPEDVAGAVEYLLSLSEKAAVDQIYIRRRNSQPF